MQHRKINPRVRGLIRNYLKSCIPGTRINSKGLANQLSDRNRVYLSGTVAQILCDMQDVRCVSVNNFVVVVGS